MLICATYTNLISIAIPFEIIDAPSSAIAVYQYVIFTRYCRVRRVTLQDRILLQEVEIVTSRVHYDIVIDWGPILEEWTAGDDKMMEALGSLLKQNTIR